MIPQLRSWPASAAMFAVLCQAALISAAEFKHLDGIHRIPKVKADTTAPPAVAAAQITPRAVLLDPRGKEEVCGTSMNLCAASLGGGCCPDNYNCAKQSCYATTNGPDTCGGQAGWHACGAVYGGGCCPQGYICETAGNCVPPSGTPYTFSCPASYYLCPSSVQYGCCPNGMGCGMNQCYSTAATPVTTVMVITTTVDQTREVITTTATTSATPVIPTTVPTAESGSGDDGEDGTPGVAKFIPSVLAQVQPTESSTNSGGGGGGGGLSKGALAGIVIGAVIVLLSVLLGSWYIVRKLNLAVAVAAKAARQSNNSRANGRSRRGGGGGGRSHHHRAPGSEQSKSDGTRVVVHSVNSAQGYHHHQHSSNSNQYPRHGHTPSDLTRSGGGGAGGFVSPDPSIGSSSFAGTYQYMSQDAAQLQQQRHDSFGMVQVHQAQSVGSSSADEVATFGIAREARYFGRLFGRPAARQRVSSESSGSPPQQQQVSNSSSESAAMLRARDQGQGPDQQQYAAHDPYSHNRGWSNTTAATVETEQNHQHGNNGLSNGQIIRYSPATELEAKTYVPELMSPYVIGQTREEQRTQTAVRTNSDNSGGSRGGETSGNVGRANMPPAPERKPVGTAWMGQPSATHLGVVSEDIHGFFGPRDVAVGNTEASRPGSGKSKSSASMRDGWD